jgi:hypothetical protein
MTRPILSFALVTALLTAWAPAARAVPIAVNYTDSASEGFWDPALGRSRRAAFEYAAGLWASTLGGSVTVVIDASMDPMGGGASSAVLGSAGPRSVHRDFAGAPQAGTWYVGALANQLAGTDLYPGAADIQARFNSDVDNSTVLGGVDWYYGVDGNPGGDIDFVSVVLHEFGHGLGFLDLIDESTGAWLGGFPDAYGRNLRRESVGQFTTLTDGQRLAALTSASVVWTGAHAAAEHGGDVPIHAPASYQPGSSISHWSTNLTPNELMEPFYTGPSADPGMAVAALEDMGWSLESGGSTTTLSSTTTSTPATSTTSTTTTLPPTAPFLCYKVKMTQGTPPFPHRHIALDDGFDGSRAAEVSQPSSLCSPATLDGSAAADRDTHVAGYAVRAGPHKPVSTIAVNDPFGLVVVDTVSSERLLVPTAVDTDTPPAAESLGVDRFQCYRVRLVKGSPTAFQGVAVALDTAFTPSKTFVLKKPKTLCAPADTGGGVQNPAAHLLCYKIRARAGEPRHQKRRDIHVANELGTLRVDTKKEDVLCVPAVITRFD